MILDSLKLLKTANKTGLTVDDIFILQTIYDYSSNSSDLDNNYIELVTEEYSKYYETNSKKSNLSTNWKLSLDKMLSLEYIVDNRIDKSKIRLSEYSISDIFMNLVNNTKTDEELFEQAKYIYPEFYRTQFNTLLPNFNMGVKEESDLFKAFKKQVLVGNKMQNWFEFYSVTTSIFEDISIPSPQRFDRYINNFKRNKEEYKKMI